MTDPLFVQTDGVRDLSEVHSQVVSGLSGLTAAESTGVQTSHGAIASAVSSALSHVLDGRGATLGATSTSASTIADLLQKAAGAYAAGDEEGASRLKAAAAALEDRNRPGACGAPGTQASGGPSSAGADVSAQMGQIMGQVGQQVGQLAQAVTAPLQGLAQGLQQVPQQIMQGVQQAAQAAQAGRLEEGENLDGERADKAEREDTPEAHKPAEPTPVVQAQAGPDSPAGRAPVEAPPTARPAPTRPQVD